MRGADVDRFYQALWNTLHGRFMYSTIKDGSILSNHFSPYMALLSPLLLLWEDVRVLYLVQICGMAATGLILYRMVHKKRPALSIWFLLAFFLNPNLHQVALHELRRISLALPFLAWSAYALHKRQRVSLLISVVLALLCKEDVGLIVLALGVHLLLMQRDWKWGAFYAVLGAGWFVIVTLWVMPVFGEGGYTGEDYFASWGDSFWEIATNMLVHPGQLWRTMFDTASWMALLRGFLPLAFLLPLLGADYLLIALPLGALMLAASEPDMHALQRWYMAPLLPFMYAAVAVGIGRVPKRFQALMVGLLLGSTLIGYALYSPFPLGKQYEAHRYRYTERHEKVWQIIETVPQEASVAAQVAFSTQLGKSCRAFFVPVGG